MAKDHLLLAAFPYVSTLSQVDSGAKFRRSQHACQQHCEGLGKRQSVTCHFIDIRQKEKGAKINGTGKSELISHGMSLIFDEVGKFVRKYGQQRQRHFSRHDNGSANAEGLAYRNILRQICHVARILIAVVVARVRCIYIKIIA